MFERLKAPGTTGRLTLKNRVFMPAMGVFMAVPGGGVNDDIIAFYEARARGGWSETPWRSWLSDQ